MRAVTAWRLNESPSQKEGKSGNLKLVTPTVFASMKVPPKRKGNEVIADALKRLEAPQ